MFGIQERVGSVLDFVADIEIDGAEVSVQSVDASSSGDNTIYTPTTGKRIKIYRVSFNAEANITGAVSILVGSTTLFKYRNPRAGAEYGFNVNPNFYLGAANEVLKINLPGTTAVSINYCLEEVP